MSDKYIEKLFLYLLVLSVLFHVAVFELIRLIPPEKTTSSPEPTMVDLTELPEPPPEPAPKHKPRINLKPERPQSKPAPPPVATAPTNRSTLRSQAPPNQKTQPIRMQQDARASEPVTHGEGLFKPKNTETIERSRLFPSASKMARLEDSYREKYSQEIEDGETKFLNPDDIQFGSFMRRLETAVYGVWHYPEAALARGIEGTTPVRITFNRSGEIVHVDLLQTSGSRILDDEVMRALKQLGPIGSLPRGYTGETFKLIAFFHYGIGGNRLR